jgi:SNF2 family DNA or RNA helicase
MVFLDRMWNPTKNRQAEDRCHRIGQENPVQIIDVMARDTVDRGRQQRVADKWEQLLWLLGDKTVDLQQEAVSDALRIFMGV